jgi:hypothetical protein
MQPEASWLQVLYWKGWVSFARFNRFPIEWARLCEYPTVTDAYERKIAEITTIPDLILDENRMRKHPKATHYDLLNDFAVHSGQFTLGLSTPQRLLAMLLTSGPIGIPMLRLFDNLWPEEPLSLRTHLKRLEGAVKVLRTLGCKVVWHQNHLWASAPASVQRTGKKTIPFLESQNIFTRKDVARFFNCSDRTAKRICLKWIEADFIRIEGRGRTTFYRRS